MTNSTHLTANSHVYQQELEFTQNEAYVTIGSIPLKSNECYGTSMDNGQLNATSTVQMEHNNTHISQQLTFDYDYVIP